MNEQNHLYLSTKEVMKMLGVSKTTLWNWEAERGLPITRIGRTVRIEKGALQQWIEKQQKEGN